MSERILVTGAQGFLGRYVTAEALRQGAQVFGLGRRPKLAALFAHSTSDGRPAPLPEEIRASAESPLYRYIRCDASKLTSIEAIISDVKPDRVIHLAGALRDEDWPTLLQSNVNAAANICLASACADSSPQIILGSSGAVYGNQDETIREGSVPRPIGSYGVSKLMGDLAAAEIVRECGLDLTIFRIFNLLGPGLHYRHFTSYAVESIVAGEVARLDRIVIPVGDLSSTRDFIDVRDVAAAMLVQPKRTFGTKIVNTASGVETKMTEVASKICANASVQVKLQLEGGRSRPGADRIRVDAAPFTKLRKLEYPIDQSIADMFAYSRGNGEISGAVDSK